MPWALTCIYESLLNSNIGSNIYELIVPIIGFVLGPLLPRVVADVFA